MAKKFDGLLGDLKTIQYIAADHGWLIDIFEINKIWQKYSNTFGMSWVTLPKDQIEIWDIIKDNLTEEN